MIKWETRNGGYFTCGFYDGKAVYFEVDNVGHYMGYFDGKLSISGLASSKKEAMSIVKKYFEKNKAVEEEKVIEEVKEEVIAEKIIVEPIVEVVEEVKETSEEGSIEAPQIAENEPESISSEETLNYLTFEKKETDGGIFVVINTSVDGVIKYTTNGKDVMGTSKIYKGEFSAEGISVVKAKLYDSEKNVISEGIFELN